MFSEASGGAGGAGGAGGTTGGVKTVGAEVGVSAEGGSIGHCPADCGFSLKPAMKVRIAAASRSAVGEAVFASMLIFI